MLFAVGLNPVLGYFQGKEGGDGEGEGKDSVGVPPPPQPHN